MYKEHFDPSEITRTTDVMSNNKPKLQEEFNSEKQVMVNNVFSPSVTVLHSHTAEQCVVYHNV